MRVSFAIEPRTWWVNLKTHARWAPLRFAVFFGRLDAANDA